jgi:hypothetical protein
MDKLKELSPKDVQATKLLIIGINDIIKKVNEIIDVLPKGQIVRVAIKEKEPIPQQNEIIRVNTIAKELGVKSTIVIDAAKSLNIPVINHLSGIKPEDVDLVKSKVKEVQDNEKK